MVNQDQLGTTMVKDEVNFRLGQPNAVEKLVSEMCRALDTMDEVT